MIASLFLLSVFGQLSPAPRVDPFPAPSVIRRHAIWAQPILATYFPFRPGRFLDAPVPYAFGGQFALTPSISATFEWGYVFASTSDDNTSSPGWLMTGSVGAIIPIWGPAQLKNFFLQPRIAFGGGRAWGPRCGFNCGAIGTIPLTEAMLIVDAGIQWHFRRLFLALVVGVGAGFCTGCSANNAFLTVTGGIKGNPKFAGVSWGLDLNFLRIGVAL